MKLGSSFTSRSMSTISCMFAVAARYSLSDSSDLTSTGCERSFVSVANGFSDHPANTESSSHTASTPATASRTSRAVLRRAASMRLRVVDGP